MQQATRLSPADRTAVEVSLARLVGDMFGSLATLPLFCMGELPSPDPRGAILDHFDVWRSCLIVVREVLKSDGFTAADLPDSLPKLLQEATNICEAYLVILADRQSMPQNTHVAFAQLERGYGQIAPLIRELGVSLDFDAGFLPGERSLKRLIHDRSLRSLGERLGVTSGSNVGGSTHA